MKKSSFLQLLVYYHKPAVIIENEVCTPIHSGRAGASRKIEAGVMDANGLEWLYEHMIGDDTGDNISHLDSFACLTSNYWAWKNYQALGNPEYIGVAHYRRLLSLTNMAENTAFEYITNDFFTSMGFSEKIARERLSGVDVCFPFKVCPQPSLIDAFKECAKVIPFKNRAIDPLTRLRRLFAEAQPEDSEILEEYLAQEQAILNDLFIMRRDYFFEFSKWVWPIYFAFDKQVDHDFAKTLGYNRETRNSGIFFEFIIDGVYNLKLEREGRANIRYLPMVWVANTDVREVFFPAESDISASVAFFIEQNRVPWLLPALSALLDSLPSGRKLDVLIINNGIFTPTQRRILDMVRRNVSIRFLSYSPEFMNRLPDFLSFGYEAAEMYQKLFLPEELVNYDKLILLDIDALILDDITKLYNIDLGDNMAALCPGANSRKFGTAFGSGAIVLNLKAMREAKFTEKCLERLPHGCDAAAIAACAEAVMREHGIMELPQEWNAFPSADTNEAKEKKRIAGNPSGKRPWNRSEEDFAPEFMNYALKTTFLPEIATQVRFAGIEVPPGREGRIEYTYDAIEKEIEENAAVFARYKGCHQGRDAVLVAPGPTMHKYAAIPGAVHLGVNKAVHYDKVRLDFLFASAPYIYPSHFSELAASLEKHRPGVRLFLSPAYGEIDKKSFDEAFGGKCPEYSIIRHKKHVSPCVMKAMNFQRFIHNIDRELLAVDDTVPNITLMAMQFLLYTQPRRLYLVGCDGSAVLGGQSAALSLAKLRADWLELREFAQFHYPHTEILSLNPMRLKGIFYDIYSTDR